MEIQEPQLLIWAAGLVALPLWSAAWRGAERRWMWIGIAGAVMLTSYLLFAAFAVGFKHGQIHAAGGEARLPADTSHILYSLPFIVVLVAAGIAFFRD